MTHPLSPSVCSALADATWLYEHFDRDGELLYIGITRDLDGRTGAHRSQSRWWRFVATTRAELFPTAYVPALEAALIAEERPLFNVTHASADTDERAIVYAARREAWDIVDHLIEITGLDVDVSAAADR